METEDNRNLTEQLLNQINNADSIENYIEDNEGNFWNPSLTEYLEALLKKYKVKKSEIFQRAGLVGNNYGYEIFNGAKKQPSRDILIQICIAFPLSVEEAQQVLRKAGKAILYPRDKRDAFILFALKRQMTLDELNDKLFENGIEGLGLE